MTPGAKRFTTEQIVAKLREAEKLQAQGLSIAQLCKRLQISDQTFYRWRLKCGALKEDEAHRLKARKALEARERPVETDRGRAGPGHFDAEGSATGKLVGPSRRRAAVEYLVRRRPGSSTLRTRTAAARALIAVAGRSRTLTFMTDTDCPGGTGTTTADDARTVLFKSPELADLLARMFTDPDPDPTEVERPRWFAPVDAADGSPVLPQGKAGNQ